MLKRVWILLFLVWSLGQLVVNRPARADEPAPVANYQFYSVSGASLADLSSGQPGEGILVYYWVRRSVEQPGLVVRLHKDAGAKTAVAEAYAFDLNQKPAPIQVGKDKVQVTPGLRPNLLITTLDGWWVRGDRPSYNLDIQVNGPIYSMWGGAADPKFLGAAWTTLIKPGEPASLIQVRDPDGEGIPKWDWRSLVPAFAGQGYYRTNYAERRCATPLVLDPGVSPLWPYVAQEGEFEQQPGHLGPPIIMDWPLGKITTFAELVTARSQNCSYVLYSLSKLVPGQLNQPDFESPFAFYDLSGQSTGYPNLILRTERFALTDPWNIITDPSFPGRARLRDWETVRYSWSDAIGDGSWNYKIEALGFHPYTATTAIAGGLLTVDAPAYESYPGWVTQQTWPAMTFIDSETTNYLSSEGIYDWSPRAIGEGYLLGWKGAGNLQAFATIRNGLRGEYRFQRDLPPQLYVGSLDHQLHLLGAEAGLWALQTTPITTTLTAIPGPQADSSTPMTVTAKVQLREANLDGGLYINAWTREQVIETDTEKSVVQSAPEVKASLYALDGYLIYSGYHGDNGPPATEIREAAYTPAEFEILPPNDKASWQAFSSWMAPYKAQTRDPLNLRSWIAGYAGKALVIEGGEVSGFHAIPGGFHLELDLQPGFSVNGDSLLPLAGLAAGQYSVNYQHGFSVEPLRPPSITGRLLPTTLSQLQPGRVPLSLQNTGGQDVLSATIELWATPAQQPARLVATQTVTLLAAATLTTALQWTPPTAGHWTLTPQITQAGATPQAFPEIHVNVAAAPIATAATLVAGSTGASDLGFLALALLTLALLGSLIVWRQSQVANEESR